MQLSIAVAAASLALLRRTQAQVPPRDAGSIPKFDDIPPPPEWEDVEHPPFEPYPVDPEAELLGGALFEQFAAPESEIWELWQRSEALRDGKEPYVGEWAIEEAQEFIGFENDRGLVLKSEGTAAAIARELNPPLSVSKSPETWVLQYEVKLNQPLRCGGAYAKLLPPPSTAGSGWSMFSNETPYLVMFGPDKCGATDKVHFILRQNGTEHHLKSPPRSRTGSLSTLYTLVVHADQRFEIRINGEPMRYGSLLDADEFDPPLVPPREIEDPNDTKPEDWDDEELIPDPNEPEKPADWDEDAPYLIPDPEAVKPEAWREDIPLFIADPDATKPADWDDEEDGEWTAPEILNPECQNLNEEAGEGCGEWLAPLIRNPNFKGKWTRPQVLNPNFKGIWEPRKIANPEFDTTKLHPGQLEQDIGGIGFEIFSMQSDILFDNIYIGHSIRDAENLGNATWSPKYAIENEARSRAHEAYRREAAKNAERYNNGLSLLDRYRMELEDFRLDPYNYVADTYNAFIDLFRLDKVAALKEFPVTTAVVSVVACALTAILFGLFNVVLVLATGRSMRSDGRPTPRPTPAVKVTPVDKDEASGEDSEGSD